MPECFAFISASGKYVNAPPVVKYYVREYKTSLNQHVFQLGVTSFPMPSAVLIRFQKADNKQKTTYVWSRATHELLKKSETA